MSLVVKLEFQEVVGGGSEGGLGISQNAVEKKDVFNESDDVSSRITRISTVPFQMTCLIKVILMLKMKRAVLDLLF